jgi:DTW domain-containing protein
MLRCVCAAIPRVETRTRFVILRHNSELYRPSNTAHFAALAMPGCEIVEYGRENEPFDDTVLPTAPGTFLLFEGGRSQPAGEPCRRLIVLDGTWSQARRMRQRVQALRGLPILTLPAPVAPRRRLRKPARAEEMSTLEAIARAVALLEGEAQAAPLERFHDAIVHASWSAYNP